MQRMKRFVLEPEAIQLLDEYDIAYPDHAFAENREKVLEYAEKIGFPVVVKVVSPQIVHKSDVGGISVNLRSSNEILEAIDRMEQSISEKAPGAEIGGWLVAKQAGDGTEVIIGILEDEIFGKALLFGMGGIFTEIFNDVTFRICPVSVSEAEDMIGEIKGYRILKGYRGKPGTDIKKLANLLSKVSELAVEHSEICEMDLNPVRVYEDSCQVLDARMFKTEMAQ